MDTKISPQWTTVALVALLLAVAVVLALTGHGEHVDAAISAALALAVPLRGRITA